MRFLTWIKDWPPRSLCDRHLQLGILPLARPPVPRNFQRRRGLDRCLYHMRGHFVCVGYWQWTRKPCRELSALRLRRPLHLSDLYGLPALVPGRAGSFAFASG